MKARIIIFAGLFIVMAIYCLMTLARSVQLTRDLIRLMKEEEK